MPVSSALPDLGLRSALSLLTILAMVAALVVAVPPPAGASEHSVTVNSADDRALDAGADTAADECDTGQEVDGQPECTLRAAVQLVNAGDSTVDEIVLPAPGTLHTPAGAYELEIASAGDDAASGDLVISSDVTIVGDGAPTDEVDGEFEADPDVHTIIRPADGFADRAFRVEEGAETVAFDGLVVEGFDHDRELAEEYETDERGAFLYNEPDAATTITITGSAFVGNVAFTGSVVDSRNREATVGVTDSLVHGNEAARMGGAFYITGELDLTGSVLTENACCEDATGFGGGVVYTPQVFEDVLYPTSVTITDTLATGNLSGGPNNSGGVVHTRSGSITVTDSQIVDNEAVQNGGAIFLNSGSLELTSSDVSDNVAGTHAGAIHANGSASGTTISIRSSTLSGNTAGTHGGAIVLHHGDADIADSTLSDNTARHGGAIYQEFTSGDVILTNSTVSGNTADSGPVVTLGTGGGVHVRHLVSQFTTFAGNVSETDGEAIYIQNSASLTATVISGPGDHDLCTDDDAFTLETGGGNVAEDGSCWLDPAEGDEVVADAGLEGLADNGGPSQTHALELGSPAVNRVDESDCVAILGADPTDQRGISRPQGDACDIGAFELVPDPAETCDVSWEGTESDSWHDPDNWSGGAVPGEGDAVCIDVDVNVPVVYDTGETTIASLHNTVDLVSGAAALRIEGGDGVELELAEDSALTHNGIELAATVDNTALSQAGALKVSGELDLAGGLAWSSGILRGDGETTTGDLELTSGTLKQLDNHTLVSTGVVDYSGSFLRLAGGDATFVNEGTFPLEGAHGVGQLSGNASTFDNQGTVTVDVDGTAFILTYMINDGDVEVESGQLEFGLGGESTGSITIADGATVDFRGETTPGRDERFYHLPGSEVTGDGTVATSRASGFVVDGIYDVGTTSLVGFGVFWVSYAKFNVDATTDELIVEFSRPRGPGTLTVTGDVLYLGDDTRDGITIDAGGDLELTGTRRKRFHDNSTILIGGSATHDDGTVEIDENSILDVAGTYTQTDGIVEIDGGALNAALVDVSGDGVFGGVGDVGGPITNAGVVGPATTGFGGGPGTLAIAGEFTQNGDGVVDIDIAGVGAGEFGQLDVDGTVTLDGGLVVTVDDAFTPSDGDEFVIISADTVSGVFDRTELAELDGDAEFVVDYRAGAVVLVVEGGDEPTSPSPDPDPEPVTESTGDEATEANPFAVGVFSPMGGPVSIEVLETISEVADQARVAVEWKTELEVPPASSEQPVEITFRIHTSLLPPGVGPDDLGVLRDGVEVPECEEPASGHAVPDPCVVSRSASGAEMVLTVLTSEASTWIATYPDPTYVAVDRFDGANRYETAAKMALATFAQSDVAFIATGENHPDALAANYLAGQLGAPVLLSPGDATSDHTLGALQNLGVSEVVLLGGTSALSVDVEETLEALGYDVDRIAGSNRYETAALTAQDARASAIGTFDGRRTAVLASGEDFPDALVSSAVAYAEAFPVLLARTGDVPESTLDALRALDIEHVLLHGGPAAVSAEVESALNDLGITTTRIAGDDRVGTAVAAATFALAELGWEARAVNLARGDDFADSLAFGAHAGETRSVILHTHGPDVASEGTLDFLGEWACWLGRLAVGGDTSALTDAVVDAARDAAAGC